MDALYQFASGTGVYITLVLFVGGLAVQLWRFQGQTQPKELRRVPSAAPPAPAGKRAAPERRPGFWGLVDLAERVGEPVGRLQTRLSRSVAGTHSTITVVTLTFHLLLIVTPIFLGAHNTLIRDSLGYSLPAFPEALSDFLTFVVLICLGVFLFRRMFMRRVRAITSAYDYFVLLITAAPFVTGFLCYHQWGPYMPLLTAHVITGELMLILIPFTRLGHALFFFLYRFFMDHEYSFGQGRRIWTAGPRGT